MEEEGIERVPLMATAWRLPSAQLCISLDTMGLRSPFPHTAVSQYLKACLCKYQELSETPQQETLPPMHIKIRCPCPK